MAEYDALPHPRDRSSLYSGMLHDFFVTFVELECLCKQSLSLCSYTPECTASRMFSFHLDRNIFKSRINRLMPSLGSF